MAFAESWHVRSRARECAATQQRFNDGEKIITALFPDPESSGYVRRDYCVDAWEAREAEAQVPFSFWRSIYSAPDSETKADPMKKLSPEELLERLIEEDQEHTENTRYILAVMLERQKLLRETDSQPTPHGILRVYEHRKNGQVYLVRDPNIPLAEVDKVQQEVIVLLENNGRLPEPAEETEPVETNDPVDATDLVEDSEEPQPRDS